MITLGILFVESEEFPLVMLHDVCLPSGSRTNNIRPHTRHIQHSEQPAYEHLYVIDTSSFSILTSVSAGPPLISSTSGTAFAGSVALIIDEATGTGLEQLRGLTCT